MSSPARNSRLAQHATNARGSWATLPGLDWQGIARDEDEWLTPRWILDALGRFDLDPCAFPEWPTAQRHYFADDDGLEREWRGRVWLNPPYSHTRPWLARLAEHGAGVALIPVRPESTWFRELVWSRASSLLFLARRPQFVRASTGIAETTGYGASVLVGYGETLADVELAGAHVDRWQYRE